MLKKICLTSLILVLVLGISRNLWPEEAANDKCDIVILENEIMGLKQRLKEISREKELLKGQARPKEKIAVTKPRNAADKPPLPSEFLLLKRENQALKDKFAFVERESAIFRSLLSAQVSPGLRRPALVKEGEKGWDKVILLNLGFAYAQKGLIDESIKAYTRALKYAPADKDIHYNLGYLLAAEKKYKESIAEFNSAFKGNAQDKEVFYNLAVIYGSILGDYEQATLYYNRFLDDSFENKLSPKNGAQ